jgi:predicted phage terminase large subunit-like protein
MTGTSKKDAIKLAYSKLLSYACMSWPGYIIGRQHLIVAHYLEAIEAGKINRLIINMPPRHGKTMLLSYFEQWYIGRNPHKQIIYATYGHEKAGDVGGDVRNGMIDPTFKTIFPNCEIDPASKGKNKISTLKGGNIFSVGVNGVVTGRGANLFLIDDPIKNREDADSETSQRKLRDWFRGVAYTRLMDNDNAIIVNLTRWHHWDIVGWALEELKHENWQYLSLPAIAEENDDIIGRNEGEALWPEKYNEQRLATTRMTVGTREWNAQYQQRPTPAEGGMVDLAWFGRYAWSEWLDWFNDPQNKRPPFGIKRFVQSWDTAFKEKEINDPSAGTVWGVAKHGVYLVGLINRRMAFPDLRRAVIDLHGKYSKRLRSAIPVLVEDKASGQSLIQDLKRDTSLPIIKIKPDASKIIRFDEVTPLVEAGKVYLPEQSPWLVTVETQLERFPHDKHDDIVDSCSQFLRWQLLPKRKSRGLKFWK